MIKYTQEQTDTIVAAYAAANTVEARKAVVIKYAKEFDKSTQSIISKLAREGVYVKTTTPKAAKTTDMSKQNYIEHICIMTGIRDTSRMESLDKASKAALMLLSEHLNKMNDRSAT